MKDCMPSWWSKDEKWAYKRGLITPGYTLSPMKTTEGIWYMFKAATAIKNAEVIRLTNV